MKDAVRGHLDGLILAVLEAGPRHGYAVIGAIRDRSDGSLDLPTGTVYPALRRLEREGLLHAVWEGDGARPRRTYRLTETGERRLGEERSTWRTFAATIGAVLDPGAGRGAGRGPATATP